MDRITRPRLFRKPSDGYDANLRGLLSAHHEKPREVELLEEPLVLGELYANGPWESEFWYRIEACARLFREDPLMRLLWLPHLRRCGPPLVGRDLWSDVEPYLLGETPVQQGKTAEPTSTEPKARTGNPPAPKTDDGKERARLAMAFQAWSSECITDDAFRTAKALAPALVAEAMQVIATADATPTATAARRYYKRAGEIWAQLLNLEEPSL